MQTLSALRIGRLYPQEIFLLEAESTSGPQCGLKDYVNDTIGNRTRDLPAGIAVPQPTATPHAPETVVILWIAVPYIVDCVTVYCGLRYRIFWIAVPYTVFWSTDKDAFMEAANDAFMEAANDASLHFVETPKYELLPRRRVVKSENARTCMCVRVKQLHGSGHTFPSFRVAMPTCGTSWYQQG